jgi:hypothetical protein
MDGTKDTQISNLSRFLDVYVRTDPFGENRSGERAYRRAERLVAALFLLTRHIPSDETLRSETRRIATSILPQILALRDDMRAVGSAKAREFQATIRLLISLLKMLMFSGYISSQNAESASEALDDLGNFISASQRSAFSESVKFSRDDLLNVRDPDKGRIKDIRDKESIKDKLSIKDTPEMSFNDRSAAPLPARASTIISVLRAGGDFNIRDIAANLPEYSEKTIQREIALLVERGLVRRTGLKRWSRYSIA